MWLSGFLLDKITSFRRLFSFQGIFPLHINENIKNLLLNNNISYAANSNKDVNEVRLLEGKAKAEASRMWPRDRGQASRPSIPE